jgi:3-hydroxyacyl-CoA dehydrogenase/enoyl-CoA hydratase/3-hydroxybutyryl-CoA epimerase
VAEVKRRLMYVQSIETVRCIEEGVVTAPIDANVDAVLGWAFPPCLGGPIGQIHSRGVAAFVADCEHLAHRHGPRFAPPELLRKMAGKGEAFYQR